MAKFKILTAGVLAVLLFVVIVQNRESVETKLLFVTLEMPRAALLFLTMLIGFVIGLLTAVSVSRKPKAKASG